MDAITTRAALMKIRWWSELTQDEKDRHEAARLAWFNEESQPALRENFNNLFAASDADGDGFLNFEEYLDMQIRYHHNLIERGIPTKNPADTSREASERTYNALKAVGNPDDNGISVETCIRFGEIYTLKLQELVVCKNKIDHI